MARLKLGFLERANVKKVFRDACQLYDLVYFGYVSQHSDEHQMVRGFTLSPSHTDQHYCVGTVSGRDIVLMQRTDTISFPAKPSRAYTWLVLQVDLNRTMPVHMLLNSCRYDEVMYDSLLARLSHLHTFEAAALARYDQAFTSKFHVFAPLSRSDEAFALLNQETVSILGHHFAGFDYEIIGDELIISLPTASPTPKDIEHIIKSGIWFAGQLDGMTHSAVDQPM